MGVSGFYQETTLVPKAYQAETPSLFLLYLTRENTFHPGLSSPLPLPPRPIYRP